MKKEWLNINLVILFIFTLYVFPKASFATFNLVPAHPDPRDKETFTYIKIKHAKQGEKYEEDFFLVNTNEKEHEVKLKGLNEASKFIKFEKDSYVIPSNKRVKVNFSFILPKKFPDGEYIFYIAALDKQTDEILSKLPIKIYVGQKRFSKLEVKNLKISIKNNKLYVSGILVNKGNTILDSQSFFLKLTNTTAVLNWLSKNYEFFWTTNLMLNPEEKKEFRKTLPSNLTTGNYLAEFKINFADKTSPVKRQLTISNFNPVQLLIDFGKLFLTLILIFFIIKKLKLKAKLDSLKEKLPKPNSIFSFATPKTNQNPSKQLPTFNGLIKKVFEEERHLADAHNVKYDRLLFEIRRIVREEIELWKEMENFKKRLREKLEKEREEILKERLKKITQISSE